ncbi:hypothetical protein NKG94_11015 [Micromonospora sp. M12]
MASEINYDGVTVTELYEAFTHHGIPASDASVLVSSWIYENVGTAKRVFSYAEAFPAVEPGCAPPPFARTFAHSDWVDGEDVVQAGETPGSRVSTNGSTASSTTWTISAPTWPRRSPAWRRCG